MMQNHINTPAKAVHKRRQHFEGVGGAREKIGQNLTKDRYKKILAWRGGCQKSGKNE
jgi:hypothetical protein